jgi:hypothetical protein
MIGVRILPRFAYRIHTSDQPTYYPLNPVIPGDTKRSEVETRDPGDCDGRRGSPIAAPWAWPWVPHLRSTAFRCVRDDGS